MEDLLLAFRFFGMAMSVILVLSTLYFLIWVGVGK